MAERVVAELRKAAAAWRASEAKVTGLAGMLRAAFLWSLTERWCSRLELLAAQVESDVAQLRTLEEQARAELERVTAAVLATPLAKPASKAPRRRK